MSNYDILYRIIPLFLKTGYKMLKMDDIASTLTISKKTIYKLFNSKEELIDIVNENLVEFFVAVMKNCEAKSSNSIEFCFVLRQEAEKIISLPDQRSFMLQADKLKPAMREKTYKVAKNALYTLAHHSITKAANENYVNEHTDIHTIATIFATNYINILIKTPFDNEDEFVHTFVNWYYMHLRGLFNNEGNKLMDEYIANHPDVLQ